MQVQGAGAAGSCKGGQELLDDVQSQHYMEQQSATLMVTVLEACGMQPRRGAAHPPAAIPSIETSLTQEGSLLGLPSLCCAGCEGVVLLQPVPLHQHLSRQLCAVDSPTVLLRTTHHWLCGTSHALGAGVVVAFQANQLPNPLVELSLPGQPTYQVAAKHSLKPHFPTDHPASFHRVTQDAALTVRLYDDKAGRRNQLLGEAVLPCKQIKARAGSSPPLMLLQHSVMHQLVQLCWRVVPCSRAQHPQQQLVCWVYWR